MRVAVTGGTGFVGPAIVQAMLDEGHEVVVVEHRHPYPLPDQPRLHRARGDVGDAGSLEKAFVGCEAVAHLVAIRRGRPEDFERVHAQGGRNVVDAARAAGATRLLLMSANGADEGTTPYFRTKRAVEDMVKRAGLAWTIFRPSYIASADKGGFDHEFAGIVDRLPVLPSFAGGRFEIQPVSRRDVALAFARALSRPQSVGKTYVLVGRERFTWREYLRRLMALRGRRRPLLYAPGWAVIALATVLGRLFPASPDELRMLMQGSVGDPEPAARDLDLPLERWEDAVAGLRAGRDASGGST